MAFNNNITPGAPPLLWSNIYDAFTLINENFDSLVATVGDGSGLTPIDFSTLDTDVSPSTDNLYSLGASDYVWRAVYTGGYVVDTPDAGNGVWIGAAQIKGIDTYVDIPAGSTINGALLIDPEKTFFKIIDVDNGNSIEAQGFGDTVKFLSGDGISMVVDSAGESITFNNEGILGALAGSGIGISDASGVITVTNTGVLSLTSTTALPNERIPGAGININNSTGSGIKITNTGVIGISSGTGIIVIPDTATGIFTIVNSAPVGNTFSFVEINGDSDNRLAADTINDILSINSGQGITLTKNVSTDALTITVDPNFNLTGNVLGNTTGYHYGDVTGSVFSDDSTKIIDSVENKIYSTFFGNLTGDVTGSVFGDDSTLLVDGVNSKIVGDIETASLRTSDNNIALGNSAGFTNQGTYGIALGFGAGDTNQGIAAIGIGYTAGQTTQGTQSVAIGYQAGMTAQLAEAVAIGTQAGQTSQGASSVAIGPNAGNTDQGLDAVAIGKNAGKTTQGTQSVAIGYQAGMTAQLAEAVAIGVQAGLTGQNAGAIAIGTAAGETTQGSDAIAIGSQAGRHGMGVAAIAIGRQAGAGGTTTATYVSGGELDTTLIVDDTTGIFVGARISGTGFSATVAMQPQVLSVDNGTTLTIESMSLSTPSGILTFNAQQFNFAVGIGVDAGAYGQQGYTVALGYGAGKFVQGEQAIAIGASAGNINQGLGGVAIGTQAGETNQDTHGIAVGKWAGRTDQANEAIAIGYQAGYTNQGEDSIAIGKEAGKTNQAARSIILNATDNPLENTVEDSFVVKPVRGVAGATLPEGFKQVAYNPTTGEFIYYDA